MAKMAMATLGNPRVLVHRVVYLLAATLAFAILWRRWSEKTGVSVTGLSPRRARWVAIALGVVFLALALASVYFGRTSQYVWVLPLIAAAFVLALVFSRLWMRVYRAETATRP